MEATFKIDGMSCEHCQARVRAALLEQAGVSAANVSLANGTATVLYDAQVTSPYALLQAIGDVGFDVKKEAARAASFFTLSGTS